jgi:hypothetical protein
MGPTFSGSAASLAHALKNWLQAPKQASVKIISGSATAINRSDFLRLIGARPSITFQTTVIPDLEASSKFLEEYLKKELKATDDNPMTRPIALLSEANTSYGRFREQKDQERQTRDIWDSVLQLHFPIHISQVRSASARINPSRTERTKDPLSDSNALSIPLEQGGEPKARDAIPLYSQVEMAAMEQMLASILSTINREGVRYIYLVATDVQDRIFLVRKIREHCPNTVIVTFDADLLYLHPEANLDFLGSLVITPYPLFGPNQHWSSPFTGETSRLQFSTQLGYGMYNATLALLGKPKQMLEYSMPFDASSASSKPPLWISLVGRDGFWPVKVIEIEDQDQIVFPNERPMNQASRASSTDPNGQQFTIGDPPHSPAGMLLLMISLICFIPTGIVLLQLIRLQVKRDRNEPVEPRVGEESGSRSTRHNYLIPALSHVLGRLNRLRLARLFGDEKSYKYSFDRRVYLFECCLCLLLLSLLIAGVLTIPIFLNQCKQDWYT